MAGPGGVVLRRPAADVLAELKAAEDAARAAEEDARRRMREQRRDEDEERRSHLREKLRLA